MTTRRSQAPRADGPLPVLSVATVLQWSRSGAGAMQTAPVEDILHLDGDGIDRCAALGGHFPAPIVRSVFKVNKFRKNSPHLLELDSSTASLVVKDAQLVRPSSRSCLCTTSHLRTGTQSRAHCSVSA